MPARSQVVELVQGFHRNLDLYERQGHKEARVRIDFTDPFFEALDCDARSVRVASFRRE